MQWKHISSDFKSIDFEQAVIETSRGRVVREGLKTQERRRFPCNDKLQKLLQSIQLVNCNPESPVFPGYGGKLLDTSSLPRRL